MKNTQPLFVYSNVKMESSSRKRDILEGTCKSSCLRRTTFLRKNRSCHLLKSFAHSSVNIPSRIRNVETILNAILEKFNNRPIKNVSGTSTDLVPQLLGMFDELARKDQVNNSTGDQIPSAIQKRLSLVGAHSQRNTIFGQICGAGYTEKLTMQENQMPEVTVCQVEKNGHETIEQCAIDNFDEKTKYNSNRLMPEQALCDRQKKHHRPLSASSIASSTSSSGGSNQGNTPSANPYLASVESLADACASSQGQNQFFFPFENR